MNSSSQKIALVTGANSGLGYEAAYQLSQQGYEKILLVCRSQKKAVEAKLSLEIKSGKRVFEAHVADMADLNSVTALVTSLSPSHPLIDLLILNAGVWPGTRAAHNNTGLEIAFASTLLGHHALTVSLLKGEKLSNHARIIISGSELARGDFPGASLPNMEELANQHFKGNLTQALLSAARATPPYSYISNDHYGLVKLWVSWWAFALAKRLPEEMAVNSVSPGIAIGTNAKRHQPKRLQFIMSWLLPLLKKSASVPVAAKRYLDGAQLSQDESGHFFASPNGKFVGEMVKQSSPHLFSIKHQEACWEALETLCDNKLSKRT